MAKVIFNKDKKEALNKVQPKVTAKPVTPPNLKNKGSAPIKKTEKVEAKVVEKAKAKVEEKVEDKYIELTLTKNYLIEGKIWPKGKIVLIEKEGIVDTLDDDYDKAIAKAKMNRLKKAMGDKSVEGGIETQEDLGEVKPFVRPERKMMNDDEMEIEDMDTEISEGDDIVEDASVEVEQMEGEDEFEDPEMIEMTPEEVEKDSMEDEEAEEDSDDFEDTGVEAESEEEYIEPEEEEVLEPEAEMEPEVEPEPELKAEPFRRPMRRFVK